MRHAATLVVLLAALSAAAAPDILLPGNLKTLGCAPADTRLQFVRSSQPGNVFYPGDPVHMTIKVTRGPEPLKSIRLGILEIGTRQNKYLEGMSVMTAPPAIELLARHGHYDVPVGDAAEVEARDIPIPARYGTYALTVAPNGKAPQFLCTLLRAHKPVDGFYVDAPVFGEGQFLTHDNQKPERILERARTLERLGIKGVRIELGWAEGRKGTYDWERFDALMNALAAAKIKALVTMGGHCYWAMPLGQPTPACIPEKPDHSCMPKYYDDFGHWIRAFCERYWKGGEGSLWAIEHWNEPWEGISISGWESDSRHFRELMRRIAVNARAVDPRIKTAAACSIMNTEDKFLAGEDRDEWIKLVDLFTDHYVPPRTSYGPMVAKYWGKESTDTETWIAATEVLLPQIVCQFLACGQDRMTPWHPEMTYYPVPGSPMKHHLPNPVALASNVFNVFITGRKFQRVLFHHHLPWAFQFGEGTDAVVIFFGKLYAPHGGSIKDVLWWQLQLQDGGTIALDNADGQLEFFDIAGNREFEGQKQVTLPMDYLSHYIRSPRGGIALMEQRLKAARIDGVRPVEILAHDLPMPVDAQGAAVRVTLHNLLNRPIEGTLTATAPKGMLLVPNTKGGAAAGSATVLPRLGPGESADFSFRIAKAAPSPTNTYLFRFAFASRDGNAEWAETLNVCTARKGTKKVDGDLGDWGGDLGVMVDAKLQKVDPTAQAWMPFLKAKDVQADGSFAEVKLAWDDAFLYVAARVNDPTDYAGHQRLETWDEDQYFRSAKDDAICETLRPFEKLVRADMRNKDVAARTKADPQWEAYQKFLSEHADAQAAVTTNAARVYFEAKGRNPKASFADAAHVYRTVPWNEMAWAGDTLQLGFDVLPGYACNMKLDTDRVPHGFHAMPDTDYEYAAYRCDDGKSELWRVLAPGMPRMHYYPRQPRPMLGPGAVRDARHAVRRDGSVTTYELAIPWAELKQWRPAAGAAFGFTFCVNNNDGPKLHYGADKSATKTNGLALHPYWEAKPGCGIRWTLSD